MIEKPLDPTVEGTDHILREAEKAGVRVGFDLPGALRRRGAAAQGGHRRRALRPHGARELLREVESHGRVLHGLEGQTRPRTAAARSSTRPSTASTCCSGSPACRWKCSRGPRSACTGSNPKTPRVAALKFGSGAFGTIEATTALWPGCVAAHRDLRRERLGRHGRRRHRALGFPRSRSRKTRRSARRARAAPWDRVRRRRWPSSSKATCGRFRISSTASASSGRSSSRAAKRAKPWRWCAPFYFSRTPSARCCRLSRFSVSVT